MGFPLIVALAIVGLLVWVGIRIIKDPWRADADQRFGSKNYEPPIELNLTGKDVPPKP